MKQMLKENRYATSAILILCVLMLFSFIYAGDEPAGNKENLWVTHGPWGSLVFDLEVDSVDSQIVYAYGPGGGNYVSSDGGKSWNRIIPPEVFLEDQPVHLVKDILYIYSDSSVYQSKDHGKTWNKIHTFKNNLKIGLMESGPKGVYCLLFSCQIEQVDNAEKPEFRHTYDCFLACLPSDKTEWEQFKIGPFSYSSYYYSAPLFFNKSLNFIGDDTLVISISQMASDMDSTLHDSILLTSKDGGKTWMKDIVIGNKRIVCSPRDAKTLFGISFLSSDKSDKGGIFKSVDGGATWKLLDEKFKDRAIRFIAFHLETADIYVGSHEYGLFVSRDNGKKWETLNTGLHNMSVSAIAFDPSDKNVMYCGTQHGIFKTTDGGEEWQWSGEGFAANQAQKIYIDPDNPKDIYLAEYTSGIRISRNGGESWEPIQPKRPFSNTYNIVGTDDLLIAETDVGFCRSTDGGKGWSLIESLKDKTPYNAVYCGKDEIYCLTWNDKKSLKSADGGNKWEKAGELPGDIGEGVQFIVRNGNSALAIGTEGIAFSGDKGKTWKKKDITFGDESFLFIAAVCFDPANPDVVYIGGSRREKFTQYVYRVDLKTNATECIFQKVTPNMPSGIVGIAFVNSDDYTMVVAEARAGVFVSYDKWKSWVEMNCNLPKGHINAMAVSKEGIIHLSASGAVYSMKIPPKPEGDK
ncbi:MAG: hypothetical protein HY811_10615 [Planctomycetes bacterium]|nr:hypothetical protein [Planctomycetota bacterium]